MFYTYILRSESDTSIRYVGHTSDLKARLKEHNSGKCRHTCKQLPWTIDCYFAFSNKETSVSFEKYLKCGSGHSFAKRHFE